jgi:hypothetical protein
MPLFEGNWRSVLLAYAGLRGIIAVVPPNTIPDEAQITLNGPVLLFTLAVSVVVSLLFGVTPAFQLVGRDLLQRPARVFGLRERMIRTDLEVQADCVVQRARVVIDRDRPVSDDVLIRRASPAGLMAARTPSIAQPACAELGSIADKRSSADGPSKSCWTSREKPALRAGRSPTGAFKDDRTLMATPIRYASVP